MTPPTPEQVAALEQWARDGKRIAGDPHAMVLALCETVREMQAEIDQRTQAWAVAADERDRANGEKDAAVARAEQAERERDVYGDALTSLSPKVEALQEAEETAREAITERDAARAEVAQLRDIAELEATIATLREQLQAAQAVPPLPEGWARISVGAWKRAATDEQLSCTVYVDERTGDVTVPAYATPADLITVLRHAHAAHERLSEQAHPTPAQEGQR